MTRATQHCTMQPWGEARPECEGAGPTGPASGHNAPPASSPARNQPEAARVLLSSGCGANALNSTRSSALHVAVQRGFLEVVKVLCERGCDVNLPVSAGSPGSGPGVKEVVAETSLPSDHWPTTGRMPMLTHPCTAPSQRALVPAALWRSSLRCRASMSLPPTARASPCCTMRPSKATHCEFGVTHSSCCTTGPPWVAPTPEASPCSYRAVRRILARARQLVDAKKEDGFTALHLAAFNNHREVAQVLIREVWTESPGLWTGVSGPTRVPVLSPCPPLPRATVK